MGESASEAAARETLEESGYRVRPVRLLAAYDRDRHGTLHPYHVYKLVFLCEILDQTPSPDVDAAEVGFFGENELPSSRSPALPPRSHASSSTTETRTHPLTSTSARSVNPWPLTIPRVPNATRPKLRLCAMPGSNAQDLLKADHRWVCL